MEWTRQHENVIFASFIPSTHHLATSTQPRLCSGFWWSSTSWCLPTCYLTPLENPTAQQLGSPLQQQHEPWVCFCCYNYNYTPFRLPRFLELNQPNHHLHASSLDGCLGPREIRRQKTAAIKGLMVDLSGSPIKTSFPFQICRPTCTPPAEAKSKALDPLNWY